MKNILILYVILISFSTILTAQETGVIFKSADANLVSAFNWAKQQALYYKGNPDDPVGPWYEAALPMRNAFCIRDVSHQSISAEILGMSKENMNIMGKFTSNISASKKWCSYWEINKENKPVPADYLNDDDFWYNLDANFDIINACWRLYNWTGNEKYINDPQFVRFIEKSMNEYITTWKLEADSLLKRPKGLNADPNLLKRFRHGYGLPSYAEGVLDLAMSTDLIAAIYCGYICWSGILKIQGKEEESLVALNKAQKYIDVLNEKWWDPMANLYNTYYTYNGQFGKGEGEAFLLWFDVLKDTSKIRSTVKNLLSRKWNVENTSYFPKMFYKNGYWNEAYNYILFCADPTTKRRDYPEVSFGVIEGLVCGLMGVESNAQGRIISTLYRPVSEFRSELKNLPVLGTDIDIVHENNKMSILTNHGDKKILWKAEFSGRYKSAKIGNKSVVFMHESDKSGKELSYAEVSVNPGESIKVSVKK